MLTGHSWCWVIDPNDGTSDFLKGRKGSAISVGLLRDSVPVLGVVYAPVTEDLGPDCIAWAEGLPHLLRNGQTVVVNLSQQCLAASSFVMVSAAAASKPQLNAELCAPGQFLAMPSIAYRLARVAAGDGVCAVSLYPLSAHDVVAGHALLRASGGVLLNQDGQPISYRAEADMTTVSQRCFGGAPQACTTLQQRDWTGVLTAPLAADEMKANPIRLTTPLGQAIGNLFARALPLVEGCPSGSLNIYIFGGCAVHLLTHARGSADIDAEIEAARVLRKNEIMAVYTPPEGYEDSDGRDLQAYLDQNYTNALGPLHEDYRERAIPMEGFDGEQPLHIFVAAGVDLAISKLGRFTENDQSDIEQLIECGRVDVGQFVTLATEAIDYAVGNRSAMLGCLQMVTAKYLEEGRDATPEP